jgi:hypothetical protein
MSRASPFFEAGGEELTLLPVPRDVRWPLGEDGEAGEREGLFALRDGEDVGMVVVSDVDPRDAELVEGFAAHERDSFFVGVLAPSSRGDRGAAKLGSDVPAGRLVGSGSPIRLEATRENVLWVEGEGALAAALSIAGRLDAEDAMLSSIGCRRSPALIEGTELARAFDAVESSGLLDDLRRWRLGTALRRSLDHGSRWVVFAPNHPLIWRRLEREVRAFLDRLAADGILPLGAVRGATIRCRPSSGGSGRVELEVSLVGRVGGLEEREGVGVG